MLLYMFYVLDQESQQQFTKIIHEISGYESIVQRDKADKSFFHVNGEQFQMGMMSNTMFYVFTTYEENREKVVTCMVNFKKDGYSRWKN